MLKPMGLYAPEGRDVATRLRPMIDDPYIVRCKPNKIEKAGVNEKKNKR